MAFAFSLRNFAFVYVSVGPYTRCLFANFDDSWRRILESLRIPALRLINQSVLVVGARYLMASKAAPVIVSTCASALRRSSVRAPVFATNFGPHFGVQTASYLSRMIPPVA